MRHPLLIAAVTSSVVFLSSCQMTSNSPSSVNHAFNFAPLTAQTNLTQDVQAALARSGDPVIAQVGVQTVQSNVVLSGYVKKIRQSDTAEQLAHKVPGVQTVENHIIVRP